MTFAAARRVLCGTLSGRFIIAAPEEYVGLQRRRAMSTTKSCTQLSKLVTLTKVAQTLTSELDVKDIVHRILLGAIEILPTANAGTLYLFDEASQRLIPLDAVGLGSAIYQLAIAPGEGLTGHAFEHQTASLYPTLSTVRARAGADSPENLEAFRRATGGAAFPHSAMSAPLIYKGAALGVLTVENLTTSDVFESFDLELLDALAQSAAVAIVNARLYDSERTARERLHALNQQITGEHAMLKRRLEAQDTLAEVLTDGLPLAALATRLGRICSGRVLVVDSLYRYRASHPPTEAGSVRGHIPNDWESVVEGLRRVDESQTRLRLELCENRTLLVSPALVGPELHGYVLVEIQGREPDSVDESAAKSAALVVVTEFLRERVRVAEAERRDDLLKQLLGSGPVPAHFGPPRRLSLPVRLAVGLLRSTIQQTESKSAVIHKMLALTREALESPTRSIFVTGHDERIVVIWSRQTGDENVIRDGLRTVVEHLARAEPGWSAGFALGDPVAEWEALASAYREVRLAAEIREKSRTPAVFDVTTLGAYRFILGAASAQQALDFSQRVLASVRSHDDQHGTELIATLRTYQHQNRRLKETAKVLQIHPHTVRYRLERIQEFTGLDLGLSEDWLTLELAVRLFDLAAEGPNES